MCDKLGFGRWNARFALYGSKDLAEARLAAVRRAFGGIPGLELESRSYPGAPMPPEVHPADRAQLGIPSTVWGPTAPIRDGEIRPNADWGGSRWPRRSPSSGRWPGPSAPCRCGETPLTCPRRRSHRWRPPVTIEVPRTTGLRVTAALPPDLRTAIGTMQGAVRDQVDSGHLDPSAGTDLQGTVDQVAREAGEGVSSTSWTRRWLNPLNESAVVEPGAAGPQMSKARTRRLSRTLICWNLPEPRWDS